MTTLPPEALASKYPRVTNIPLPAGFRAPRVQRSDGGGGGALVVGGLLALGAAAWWASRAR